MKLPAFFERALAWITRRPANASEPIAADVGQTRYYHERSVVYASAQLVILMILAVYLAVSLLTGKSQLSVDNLSLLVSDFGSAIVLPEAGSTDTLTYVADQNNQFSSYRGGLAVLGGERLTVFTATGRENYAVPLQYHTPRVVTSDKYLLTYDLGGRELAVYNAFTKLFSVTTDFPIRHVAISKSGTFSVVTDDDSYASCVILYNADFQMISRIHLKEHALATALAPDGERMVIASLTSQGGRLVTVLHACVPGDTTLAEYAQLPDATPLALSFTEDGLLLLCLDGIYALDESGGVTGIFSFHDAKVLRADVSELGCVVYTRANAHTAATKVLALDTRLQPYIEALAPGAVADATLLADASLCVLTDNAFCCYRSGEELPYYSTDLQGTYHTLLPMSGGDVFVCGDARAACLRPR